MIEKIKKIYLSKNESLNSGALLTFKKLPTFISRDISLAPKIFVTFNDGKAVDIIKTADESTSVFVHKIIRKEYATIKFLSKFERIKKTIPTIKYFGKIDDLYPVLIENFIDGQLLNGLIPDADTEKTRQYFCSAVSWLKDLAKETVNENCFIDIFNKQKKNLEVFEQYFGHQFSDIISNLNITDQINVPKICRHGDFFISNLFVDKQGQIVGVIDFEDFSKIGVPLEDLFNFIVTYLFALERNNKLNFFDKRFFKQITHEVIDDYNMLFKLSDTQISSIFKYYWLASINRQMSKYRKNIQIAIFRISKLVKKPKTIFDFIDIVFEE